MTFTNDFSRKQKSIKKRAANSANPLYLFIFTDNLIPITYNLKRITYSASAITSFTSGIILFIIPSIPAFKVIIEEGQPLQLP